MRGPRGDSSTRAAKSLSWWVDLDDSVAFATRRGPPSVNDGTGLVNEATSSDVWICAGQQGVVRGRIAAAVKNTRDWSRPLGVPHILALDWLHVCALQWACAGS